MQRLHRFLRTHRHEEFRDELARAEMAGELSEFYVLNFQAILAVMEDSEFANDYLEMAEAVAASPYELAVIAENRAAHDLLRGNPVAAAEHCLATLDHVHQTEGLWNNLLIALYRLGDTEAVDATLRSFTRLNDECTARLVALLSSEPDLRDVRTRPAFRELLNRPTTTEAHNIARCRNVHLT
jgi:tetratricopeptide (TPR) repeat protein